MRQVLGPHASVGSETTHRQNHRTGPHLVVIDCDTAYLIRRPEETIDPLPEGHVDCLVVAHLTFECPDDSTPTSARDVRSWNRLFCRVDEFVVELDSHASQPLDGRPAPPSD